MFQKEAFTPKRVQDLIPIRNIYSQMIATVDQRLIKILSVTAVNTHLMSYAEEREVLEGYEMFLKRLKKPIQIERVAEPIDIQDYIMELRQKLSLIKHPQKANMLRAYIRYAKQLQEDRDMIRRNRYVIMDEPFHDDLSKEKAEKNLRLRAQDLKLELEEMLYNHKLQVTELSNHELHNYIHMFFDYENAQLQSIVETKELPYMIGRRNLLEIAEYLKRQEEDF